MATKTWASAIASTWATAASWSPSGVPAAGDDVIFNSTANGNCTVGANTNGLLSFTTTGYTGTFILNAQIIVGGNITLSGNNVFSGSSTLTVSAGTTSNVTFNGEVFGAGFRINAAATVNLVDNCVISGFFQAYGLPTASAISLKSNSAGVQRKFTLLQGGTQYIDYVNVTDINSGDGVTLWTYKGAAPSNSINWQIISTQPPPVSRFV